MKASSVNKKCAGAAHITQSGDVLSDLLVEDDVDLTRAPGDFKHMCSFASRFMFLYWEREKRVSRTGERNKVRRGKNCQETFTFSAQPGALMVKLTLERSTVLAAIAPLALMPMRTA